MIDITAIVVTMILLLLLLLILISNNISIHIPYHYKCNNIDIIASSSSLSSSSSLLSLKKNNNNNNNNNKRKSNNFIISAISGCLSCSLSHSLFVPLDVIKTKIQLDTSLKGKSISNVFNIIIKTEGYKALLQGFLATAMGYGLQGTCKFGFYEYFKEQIFKAYDKYNFEITTSNKLLALLVSSSLAEVVASWALCPLEATRIYMICNPDIAKNGLAYCMKHIVKQKGIGGLFKGIWMILLKQIPYTCCKLAGYDIIHQNILKIKERLLLKENGDNNNDVKVSDDYITHLISGAMAGVLAAIISHPADVLLSRVCGRNPNGAECLIIDGPIGLIEVMKDIGIKGLYTGLQPRAVMVGLMTSVQFLIYERMKVLVTHGQKKVDSYFYFDNSQNLEKK